MKLLFIFLLIPFSLRAQNNKSELARIRATIETKKYFVTQEGNSLIINQFDTARTIDHNAYRKKYIDTAIARIGKQLYSDRHLTLNRFRSFIMRVILTSADFRYGHTILDFHYSSPIIFKKD